jgi:hypothetical protein
MVQSNMNNRNFLILMESIKCRDLIHQIHLINCTYKQVGLMNQTPTMNQASTINQAPTDDIMAKGI